VATGLDVYIVEVASRNIMYNEINVVLKHSLQLAPRAAEVPGSIVHVRKWTMVGVGDEAFSRRMPLPARRSSRCKAHSNWILARTECADSLDHVVLSSIVSEIVRI